jgi:hypothetical protein
MIISDSHNFVFVATTKTASTSIEKRLNPYKAEYKVTHLVGSYNRHCPLKIIYEKFPFIEDCFKFAIVRNPFDWVASWYFYRKSNSIPGGKTNSNCTDDVEFKEWLTNPESTAYNEKGVGLTMSQLDIIQGNEKISMDFVGKYENLQEDFNIICDKIGIPRQKLPHANKSKHKHYTEYYDDETREIVAQKYAKDIEHFGYKFGD